MIAVRAVQPGNNLGAVKSPLSPQLDRGYFSTLGPRAKSSRGHTEPPGHLGRREHSLVKIVDRHYFPPRDGKTNIASQKTSRPRILQRLRPDQPSESVYRSNLSEHEIKSKVLAVIACYKPRWREHIVVRDGALWIRSTRSSGKSESIRGILPGQLKREAERQLWECSNLS